MHLLPLNIYSHPIFVTYMPMASIVIGPGRDVLLSAIKTHGKKAFVRPISGALGGLPYFAMSHAHVTCRAERARGASGARVLAGSGGGHRAPAGPAAVPGRAAAGAGRAVRRQLPQRRVGRRARRAARAPTPRRPRLGEQLLGDCKFIRITAT